MVSDIILTAILGSNHPSPHFTDKDSKVKMRLVPSQDLAVWANLKSSCIVPEGTVSIFSAFHVVSGRVFFFFPVLDKRDISGPPTCLQEGAGMTEGWGRGKEDGDFHSKRTHIFYQITDSGLRCPADGRMWPKIP